VDGLLKVIFEKMDSDGDGALSDSEFRQGLFQFGIEMVDAGEHARTHARAHAHTHARRPFP
jgi:hypothetical protein